MRDLCLLSSWGSILFSSLKCRGKSLLFLTIDFAGIKVGEGYLIMFKS